MASAATSHLFSTRHLEFPSLNHNHSRPSRHHLPSIILHSHCPASPISPLSWSLNHRHKSPFVVRSVGSSGGGGGGSFGGGGGGGGGDDDEEEEGRERNLNRAAAMRALVEVGRNLDSIPADLAMAIENGRVPGLIVHRFVELERSPFLRWLMQFGGFKERLLADDLFLAKVAIECGVGVFTKTAAEWERRRENFFKELDFVFADVVMAIIADFMLVWLPAPTVSLRPPIAIGAGRISKFFYGCPDNAFQVALSGTSYSFLQRIGAIMRNGAKLFAVGTSASLVGTGITNALINARKAVDKSFAGEAEDIPILSTSVAYGVYMAVSSNLRYQILAGVNGQHFLRIINVGGLCSLGRNTKDSGVEHGVADGLPFSILSGYDIELYVEIQACSTSHSCKLHQKSCIEPKMDWLNISAKNDCR
ncbi:hypothetical protein MRB53_031238 [Persea americana]|uniref:Uncharacterized protein n=1 Tax=Persea americana TaxID=3435 RepID=A0ACC2KNY5_PERAE|nr:hypothetical protein MRB53_031238 [Persea americana]